MPFGNRAVLDFIRETKQLMNIKKLETARKFFDEIKELDQDILEIEKMAQFVASGSGKAKILLQTDEPLPEKKKKKKEEVGIMRFSVMYMVDGQVQAPNDEKSITTKLAVDPTPKVMLQVLGVMLMAKQERRSKLIESLESIGIEV